MINGDKGFWSIVQPLILIIFHLFSWAIKSTRRKTDRSQNYKLRPGVRNTAISNSLKRQQSQILVLMRRSLLWSKKLSIIKQQMICKCQILLEEWVAQTFNLMLEQIVRQVHTRERRAASVEQI